MSKVEIISRITKIVQLLLNKGYCEDTVTIPGISILLDFPLEIVQHDMYEIFHQSMKGWAGFVLYDDVDDMLELEEDEILPEEKAKYNACMYYDENIDNDGKMKRAFDSGKFNEIGFSASMPAYEGKLAMELEYGEYIELGNFMKKHMLNDSDIHLKEQDLYLVNHNYYETEENVIRDAKKIADCMRKNREADKKYAINFKYGRDKKEITAYPYRLMQQSLFGRTYLVTIVESKLVFYRVDEMSGIKVVPNTLPAESIEILNNLDYMWGMEYGEKLHVRFKVYGDNFGNVERKIRRDLKDYEKVLTIVPDVDNSKNLIVEGDIIGESFFRKWLRGYGASIVVLEPKELADKMIESSKMKLDMYGEPYETDEPLWN